MKETNIKQNSLQAWILAARPKTLSGAAVPVMIGTALAYVDANSSGQAFNPTAAILSFLFAFAMQIDANFINDLFDFLNGKDNRETRLGPPRACTEGWITPKAMKRAIALTTCCACGLGLPLVLFGGMEMILIGLICVLFCFLYTTHLAGMGLGDVLVLVFFGIIPVCITYYLQLHTCTPTVFLSSISCGLVIDGLLIVNNFRDRDTDREVGKNTLVVRIGTQNSLYTYMALGFVACICSGSVFISSHPMAAFFPLIYLILHISTYNRMRKIRSGKALNKCLGETARNMFIYGLTIVLGLLL